MKKLGILLAVGVMVLSLSATTVQAQRSATASANAAADVIGGISISNNQGLNFGQIVSPKSGSINVTVGTGGTRSSSGTGDLLVGGNGQAASFDITASGNASWKVDLPSTSIDLSGDSGGNLTISSFTVDNSTGSGNTTINVGATVEIESTDAAESYSGTFDVTVSYQ